MTIRPRILRAIIPPDERDDATPDAYSDAAPAEAEDAATGDAADPVDPDFNEATYLRAFPDIADAVRRGALTSGLEHFRQTGRPNTGLCSRPSRARRRRKSPWTH
jgi:hypothetical protein